MAKPDFFSPYAHDFTRVAAAVPAVAPADPAANAAAVCALARQGHEDAVSVMVFPELCLSAYAIDDLLLQDALLDAVETAVLELLELTKDLEPLLFVGAPLRAGAGLFNCALALHRGRLLGVVPKSHLPTYREFYERRWFSPGLGLKGGSIEVGGVGAPFGADLLFRAAGPNGFLVHAEICEDLWVPNPPSSAAATAGAEILVNLSASNITIGKADTRRLLARAQSARCQAAYAYAAAGPGESTTDLAWDGQTGVFELDAVLAEGERFKAGPHFIAADVDLGRIRAERLRQGGFGSPDAYRVIETAFSAYAGALSLKRRVERFPYVPSDPERLAADCREAWTIQVQGVAGRLRATGLERLVIGVSGGLDSTQALVVCARAMDHLGLPRDQVHAYSLPGFATSQATRADAHALMSRLGVTAGEMDIRPAALQMLADLGHPFAQGEAVYDVTFENVQAGLRTDYLFRLANSHGALVVGTGDLSELGLGWCTYGVGDQMSHYNPNAGVSKTLIQHLIRFAAASGEFDAETGAVLRRILAAEITPELVPAADGKPQSTEAAVGPYALQDFNLFYLTRYGFRPSKIAYLAWCAWRDVSLGAWPLDVADRDRRAYALGEIKGWLRLFLVRFFANQFKRSALPNGPKISSGGSLSPRGDWRMPSDASAAAWLAELDAGVPA